MPHVKRRLKCKGATFMGQSAETIQARHAQRRPAWVNRWLSGEALLAWLFILPSMIGFITFYAVPAVRGVLISFTNWDLLTTPKFVGAANYQKLLQDPQFWNSLR